MTRQIAKKDYKIPGARYGDDTSGRLVTDATWWFSANRKTITFSLSLAKTDKKPQVALPVVKMKS